ncbi:MAG: DUF1080 domain-containing protein, partial [Verrucomicrobiota bacterium]|nr:DUF1080 domain-containing protein [Verrucomicrobiota bacterium]
MKPAHLLLTLVLGTTPCLAATPVTKTINLLEVIKSGEVEYHINARQEPHDDPTQVWTFLPDGSLRISGRGYGYVATKESYRDYHLVLEYKWGEKTWGKRESAARDNGILLHAHGPHGAYGGTWMAGIEAQIIEGGTGDILVLSPKLADGTELTTSLASEFSLDRDKEKIWKKGAPRQQVTAGRINWEKRDVDWADRKGFRGQDDVDSPSGQWNRLEVVAKGDTLQYLVNGVLVNEAFDARPDEGRVLLQSEAAEMFVRRFELHPPGEYKEKWNAIQASGGSNVDVLVGRDLAWTPEESQKAIELDGPYEVQLVACEPLVGDPVEVTWDAQGRMFVADMIDYPLGDPSGSKHLSRIVQLIDENGDGRMDRAVTFAGNMDFVQGLLPYRDGLVATTRTQILWLRDTDADGQADVIAPLVKGFNPRHSQLQVSSPRWGPDGCIYFNNGLDAKEIYLAASPEERINAARCNLRFDPATGRIEVTTGFGQYGGAFDDWGHHFFCTNRAPIMFAVMPYEAVIRNPRAGLTQGWENIAPGGSDARVYPLIRSHTTSDAHAGTYTAACGLGVYRGDLMPELRNNVFVCEPTGQLVSRYKIEPNGASLKATRQGDHTEFFRSRDEWTRPVNFTTGPEGAIYVCDMYRRFIDHARFFPEEFVKTHDMRQGENEGRIWRVVPKGAKSLRITHPSISTEGVSLKAAISEERKDFFDTLRAGQTRDEGESGDRSRVTTSRLLTSRLIEYAEDPWIAKAVLSGASQRAGQILSATADPELLHVTARLSPHKPAQPAPYLEAYSPQKQETIRALASCSAADADAKDFTALLSTLQLGTGNLLWWKPALLQGVAEGLPKSGGKLGVKSLAELIAAPPAQFKEAATEITALLARVDKVIADPSAPLDQRLAVIPLLAQRPQVQV